MFVVFVVAVVLVLGAAPPVLTYLVGPRSVPRERARSAAWWVVPAVAVPAVLAALTVFFIGYLGAGLTYSDAQDGIPDHVRTEIALTAWLPVVLVVALVAAAAALGRTLLVQVLGYLSPVLYLGLLVAVGWGSVTLLDPPKPPPAPAASEPVSIDGCNFTPNPSNGLPDCPTLTGPASPSPTGFAAPSPTA